MKRQAKFFLLNVSIIIILMVIGVYFAINDVYLDGIFFSIGMIIAYQLAQIIEHFEMKRK